MEKKKVKLPPGLILDPVTSSNIDAIGYDRTTPKRKSALYIRFHNKALWKYAEVPLDVYFDLMAAPSVGAFFSAMVKPVYKSQKVFDPKDEDA